MGNRPALRITLLTVLLLAVSACGSDEPADTTVTVPATSQAALFTLTGQWERAETSSFSSLTGMVVEVQTDGTEALIVTVPENEFQFQAGDVKWRSIQSTGTNEYSFEDLVRQEGSGATSYVDGIITVTGEGTLEMSFPTTATTQDWVRVSG